MDPSLDEEGYKRIWDGRKISVRDVDDKIVKDRAAPPREGKESTRKSTMSVVERWGPLILSRGGKKKEWR